MKNEKKIRIKYRSERLGAEANEIPEEENIQEIGITNFAKLLHI